MRIFLLNFFTFLCMSALWAQGEVTFKDTRVINTQSVETLKRGRCDFRIGHRFGDIGGRNSDGNRINRWSTLYGLEQARDVSIGFDFGLTDNTVLGIHRLKGSHVLRQLVNLSLKQRLMQQTKDGSKSFSITVYGLASISTMKDNETPGSLANFESELYRVTYHFQVMLAKKIGDRFAIQLHPSWTYRNNVDINDTNDLVSLGGAVKYQFTKSLALILEGTIPFSELRTAEGNAKIYPPIGVGIEWETGGGHVFQINLTNATGMSESDYIPYTRSNWSEGQFRIGFTIGRQFKLF